LTTRKQEILLERSKQYCKQLGISPEPKFIWTLKQVRELPKSIRGQRVNKNAWGYTFNRANLIYIATNKTKKLTHLDNTLRHDLIHYRFDGLPHGKNFERRIKDLKNGKTWPPKNRENVVEKYQQQHIDYNFRRFWHGVKRQN